jgi:hypothetical protein
MIVYGCSRVTACVRSASACGSRARPRSRSASSVIASSNASPGGSITMIVSSAGSSALTARILSSCSAFSQKIARDSELLATQRHSSGEFVA